MSQEDHQQLGGGHLGDHTRGAHRSPRGPPAIEGRPLVSQGDHPRSGSVPLATQGGYQQSRDAHWSIRGPPAIEGRPLHWSVRGPPAIGERPTDHSGWIPAIEGRPLVSQVGPLTFEGE